MFKLISDEEIESKVKAFWGKYGGKGLTPSEVMELHHSELWSSIAQAQLDSCEKQYQEKLREIKRELESLCPHTNEFPNVSFESRRQCQKCWQSF